MVVSNERLSCRWVWRKLVDVHVKVVAYYLIGLSGCDDVMM